MVCACPVVGRSTGPLTAPPRPRSIAAMCNLYRLTKDMSEVGRLFGSRNPLDGANFGAEVYPGYPGVVVTPTEAGAELRRMTWGFPLALTGKQGQKLKPRPVNNARSDKLDSFMWRYSFQERRCLIPLTAWAEAEGVPRSKGGAGMTRTWLRMEGGVEGSEVFAAAGIWRASDEWGDVYAMVMTDSCGAAAECHDRMPVLLAEREYGAWLGGSAAEAKALCVPYAGRVVAEQTGERWAAR